MLLSSGGVFHMTGFRDSWLLGFFVSELQAEFFEIPELRVHWHIHDSQDFKMVRACKTIK